MRSNRHRSQRPVLNSYTVKAVTTDPRSGTKPEEFRTRVDPRKTIVATTTSTSDASIKKKGPKRLLRMLRGFWRL